MKIKNINNNNKYEEYLPLPINIPEENAAKISFMKYYNYIQPIKKKYIKDIEICKEASYERIEYYSDKFKHNNKLYKSILQLNIDDDEMTTLSGDICEFGETEYIILATKKVNNYRKLLIIEFKEKIKINEKGVIFNMIVPSLMYYFMPSYKLSSSLFTFFLKGSLDYKFSSEDISAISMLKWLESNNYIKLDIENKRIIFNI